MAGKGISRTAGLTRHYHELDRAQSTNTTTRGRIYQHGQEWQAFQQQSLSLDFLSLDIFFFITSFGFPSRRLGIGAWGTGKYQLSKLKALLVFLYIIFFILTFFTFLPSFTHTTPEIWTPWICFWEEQFVHYIDTITHVWHNIGRRRRYISLFY